MNRRWTPLVIVVGALAVPLNGGSPASADASCDRDITTPVIDAADAAGIGTVLGNNDGLWVIDITTDTKGNLPDQIAVEVLDDGDADWSAGREIAALYYVRDDRLTTNECAQPSASMLEGWAPPASRQGEISHLLGGDWGSYRTVAFDTTGAPVAYGREPGRTVSMALCDDGATVAELVERPDGGGEVALRSLDSFAVFGTATTDFTGELANQELACDGSSADQVEITRSDDNTFFGLDIAADRETADWEVDAVTGLTLAAPVATNPDTTVPEAAELSLADPPSVGGWSPWLLVLAAAGGVAYVFRKAQDPAWRSSWNKPDNARNASGGRRREDATGQGHFNQ